MFVVIDGVTLTVDCEIEPAYTPLADPAGKPDTFDVCIEAINGLPSEWFTDGFIDRVEFAIRRKGDDDY